MEKSKEHIVNAEGIFLKTADEKVYKVPYTIEQLIYEESDCDEPHIYSANDFEIYNQESDCFFRLNINLEEVDISFSEVIYTGVNLNAFQRLSSFNRPGYLTQIFISLGIPLIQFNTFEDNEFRSSTSLWIVTSQLIVPNETNNEQSLPQHLNITDDPHNIYYSNQRPCKGQIMDWTISEYIQKEREREAMVREMREDYWD